jgi:hypothetical protein
MLLCLTCVTADEAPSADSALRAAIELLNQRKAAIQEVEQQKRLEDATRALEQILHRAPQATSHAGRLPLTLADVRKKLRGRAVINPKTGELTLTYDFANVAQLTDFTVNKGRARIVNRMLAMEPGDSVIHAVKFKTFTLTATVGIQQMKGELITTSEGARLFVGGNYPDTFYLEPKGAAGSHAIVPGNERTGLISIGLRIEEGRVLAFWGSTKVGRNTKEPQGGHIQLFGGEMGQAYGNLTITGQVDEDWGREFFGAKK